MRWEDAGMAVEVGTKAPDFTLKDYNKQDVTLSQFQGEKNVLLVFYPFAFSGICQGELCQVRDELADYEGADVQVLGVSVDSPFALKAWADQQGYTFPCSRTSGRTERWPRPTASSTTRPVWPCAEPS
ncbi:hypothetical protein GCM10029964_021990 [Kibdelosporangium lantanae]